MDQLKFVRAFTFRQYDEVVTKGLALPNDQSWNLYRSEGWPPGLAFDLWTSEKQKYAEWLALEIKTSTNDFRYLGLPGQLVYPGVGIIACDAVLFDEFKAGLFGIRRTAEGVVWAKIEDPGEIGQYDEFTVSESFLTPKWLLRLHAQIGMAIRWDHATNTTEGAYWDFESLLIAHEGAVRRNR